MSDTPMQGVSLKICGKVHEVRAPVGKGPVTLVLRVSHGKNKDTGEYKPSSWYNVKVFSAKQAELAASNPQQGDLYTVECWGATDEWTDREGKKRSDKTWFLSSFTKHSAVAAAPQPATVDPFDRGDDVPF